jgi:cell division protein FtsA
VNTADVARVIQAARAISVPVARQVIHVLPREFMVDGERGVRDPVGMSGVRLEVDTHLITVSSAALKNVTKAVNEVGVKINDTVFTALASAYATLSDTEKELGCVLIDIGAGTTSIAAYVDGALAYSGALPVGARNVTNDLAIGLRVSLDAAENIKLKLSDRVHMEKMQNSKDTKHDQLEISETGSTEIKKVAKRTLTEGIIKPRLNEIFSMVRTELERVGIVHKIPSGAILTGGGALTVGAEDSARKVLSVPVRVASPGGISGLIDDIVNPQFATAVGLVLYGVKQNPEGASTQTFSTNKLKNLPSGKMFTRLIESIRDLLP